MSESIKKGTFYGVGVGPGDPELMTLKAARLIRHCEVLAFISNAQAHSMAKNIARDMVAERKGADFIEYPIVMPMCDSREVANQIYDQAAKAISIYLDDGKNVVFLCEGDPFFFGSFAYLYDRLSDQYDLEVVPGVGSINAASAVSGRPLGLLAENIAIISGRRGDEDILNTLNTFDNVAIMKPGRRRQELLELIQRAGRTEEGCYIEYVGHDSQKIVHDLTQLDDQSGPYFSLLLINRPRDYR